MNLCTADSKDSRQNGAGHRQVFKKWYSTRHLSNQRRKFACHTLIHSGTGYTGPNPQLYPIGTIFTKKPPIFAAQKGRN